MIVRFTIPAKFQDPEVKHPVNPDADAMDWFEVQADGYDDAILHVNESYGPDSYQTTFIAGEREDENDWIEGRTRRGGKRVGFIDLWYGGGTDEEGDQ